MKLVLFRPYPVSGRVGIEGGIEDELGRGLEGGLEGAFGASVPGSGMQDAWTRQSRDKMRARSFILRPEL
jgi:hypothetical protein